MLYCQSHHSYRAIWNAKTRLQKPHVSPLLWFSWPRAHFKSWFRKVRFVSEKEQGKRWLHNDLRNCHPNVEGGLSATDAGILLFKTLLHKHARRHCVKTSGPSLDTTPCWYCRSKDLWTCTFISCTGDGMWCDGLQKLLKCLHFDVAKRWGGEGRGQRGIKTTKTPSRTTRV